MRCSIIFSIASTAVSTKRGCAPRPTDLYADYVRPHLYEGVEELLQRNREEGFVNVLVTGSLDFAMAPVVEALGF